MSKTKDLYEEFYEQQKTYMQNKRLSLYRWTGEITNKQLNDSGWEEDFKSKK